MSAIYILGEYIILFSKSDLKLSLNALLFLIHLFYSKGHCVLDALQSHVSLTGRNLSPGTRIEHGETLEWGCRPALWDLLWYTYEKNSQEPFRCDNTEWTYQPECLECKYR